MNNNKNNTSQKNSEGLKDLVAQAIVPTMQARSNNNLAPSQYKSMSGAPPLKGKDDASWIKNHNNRVTQNSRLTRDLGLNTVNRRQDTRGADYDSESRNNLQEKTGNLLTQTVRKNFPDSYKVYSYLPDNNEKLNTLLQNQPNNNNFMNNNNTDLKGAATNRILRYVDMYKRAYRSVLRLNFAMYQRAYQAASPLLAHTKDNELISEWVKHRDSLPKIITDEMEQYDITYEDLRVKGLENLLGTNATQRPESQVNDMKVEPTSLGNAMSIYQNPHSNNSIFSDDNDNYSVDGSVDDGLDEPSERDREVEEVEALERRLEELDAAKQQLEVDGRRLESLKAKEELEVEALERRLEAEARLKELEAEARQIEAEARRLEAEARQIEALERRLEAEALERRLEAEARLKELEAEARRLERQQLEVDGRRLESLKAKEELEVDGRRLERRQQELDAAKLKAEAESLKAEAEALERRLEAEALERRLAEEQSRRLESQEFKEQSRRLESQEFKGQSRRLELEAEARQIEAEARLKELENEARLKELETQERQIEVEAERAKPQTKNVATVALTPEGRRRENADRVARVAGQSRNTPDVIYNLAQEHGLDADDLARIFVTAAEADAFSNKAGRGNARAVYAGLFNNERIPRQYLQFSEDFQKVCQAKGIMSRVDTRVGYRTRFVLGDLFGNDKAELKLWYHGRGQHERKRESQHLNNYASQEQARGSNYYSAYNNPVPPLSTAHTGANDLPHSSSKNVHFSDEQSSLIKKPAAINEEVWTHTMNADGIMSLKHKDANKPLQVSLFNGDVNIEGVQLIQNNKKTLSSSSAGNPYCIYGNDGIRTIYYDHDDKQYKARQEPGIPGDVRQRVDELKVEHARQKQLAASPRFAPSTYTKTPSQLRHDSKKTLSPDAITKARILKTDDDTLSQASSLF